MGHFVLLYVSVSQPNKPKYINKWPITFLSSKKKVKRVFPTSRKIMCDNCNICNLEMTKTTSYYSKTLQMSSFAKYYVSK